MGAGLCFASVEPFLVTSACVAYWKLSSRGITAGRPQSWVSGCDALRATQGYAKAGQTARARDNLRWGADYLMKTISRQVPGSGRSQDFYIAYQARAQV